MSDDLAKRLRETTHMYQADCELKMKCAVHIEQLEARIADRDHHIEKLEALYEVALNDAQEAEAYAKQREKKLYDIAQDELKGQSRGPWPNAIRAVNYRVGTKKDGSSVWDHRLEQYHDGRWAAIPVYEESEDGTLEEEDQ